MRFWMKRSGYQGLGRLATWLATWFCPPHYFREQLARITDKGYISPTATIHHTDLKLGTSVFIDSRCMIFQNKDGGHVTLGDKARIYRDTIMETGRGSSITLDEQASIHPRCQLNAYLASIHIGKWTMIAANCALYSYDHGIAPDLPTRKQPLTSKGDIVIGDEVWIGTGVIILSGVSIGDGAVIGAGAVVTQSIPPGAIAVGNPARVVKMRNDL